MTTNAILNERTDTAMATRNPRTANGSSLSNAANRVTLPGEDGVERGRDEQWWQAVVGRDASHDGQFFFGVSSTGVYCRPSCPAKRPRRENVSFFRRPEEAERAGFRACLRCKPKSST